MFPKRGDKPKPKVSLSKPKIITKPLSVATQTNTNKKIAANPLIVQSIKKKIKTKPNVYHQQDTSKPVHTMAIKRQQTVPTTYNSIVTPPELKKLKLEQERKIEEMIASASNYKSEYLLNEDSPKVDKPDEILVDLMDHQKTSVAKMISLESHPFLQNKNTYYSGFLSDFTGAGKSLAILSLICLNDLEKSSNLWMPCSNSKPNPTRQIDYLNLNLILVMPNILHQWQHYLETQTTIKYGIINKGSVNVKDLEIMTHDGIKVVLVNNEMTDDILGLNLKVARLIIDEIDLYINTRKNKFGFPWILASNIHLKCAFCWFLTATPETMYNNKPQDDTIYHRFPYSCFASLSLDNMCNNLVVKNNLSFVKNNLQLENYSLKVIRCSSSDDILNCIKCIPLCQIWASRDISKLKQMIYCHDFAELTKYFNEVNIPRDVNFGDIKNFDELYKILTHKDVHKYYNGKRVCKCETKPKANPNPNPKPNPNPNPDKKPTNKDKIETLELLLKDCGSRTLVFANDSKNIHKRLKDKFSCAIFEKSLASEQLVAFEHGKINVLFLESMESMRGSNMEMTENLIICGNPGLENKIQIIGRAQRYGRTNALNILELRYDNE